MKSLFKVTLLATTMAVALNAPLTFAADTAAKTAPATDSKAAFKMTIKICLCAGCFTGTLHGKLLKEQEKLGIKLDKDQLIAGVQDAFANKSKLSDQEIEQTLQTFETRVKLLLSRKWKKTRLKTMLKAKPIATPSQREGRKTSKSGLLYKVEKKGPATHRKTATLLS